jgi:hypothetical protein
MKHGKSRYHGYMCMPDEPSPFQVQEYECRKANDYAKRIATDAEFALREAQVRAERDLYFAPMRKELIALTSSGRTRRREAQAICDRYIGQEEAQ